MNMRTLRSGYIFLISVLFLGAISLAATVSLMLLAWAAEQNGQTYGHAAQALELARACLEYGVKNLRADLTYAGQETLAFSNGNCVILATQGTGSSHRTICAEGTSGPAKKRLQVAFAELYPTPVVQAYREVIATGACTAIAAYVPSP